MLSWDVLKGNDPREPWFTFHLPHFSTMEMGCYAPSVWHWIVVGVLLVPTRLCTILTARVVYHNIVQPLINNLQWKARRKELQQQQQRKVVIPFRVYSTRRAVSTMLLFLPVWIWGPKYAMDVLGVQNKVLRFSLCVIFPTLNIFRLFEAFFGFVPTWACQSIEAYSLYLSCPAIVRISPQTGMPIAATPQEVLYRFGKFLLYLTGTGMYLSCFLIGSKQVAETPSFFPTIATWKPVPQDWYSWNSLWNVHQWKDSIFNSYLMLSLLVCFMEILAMTLGISPGVSVEESSLNPIFGCNSPSDFWGKRWNRIVHDSLKGGVYKPFRCMGYPPLVAVLATFMASGLFHEWILPVVMSDYQYRHGPAMCFFLWQVVLMTGKPLCGDGRSGIRLRDGSLVPFLAFASYV